MAVDATYWRVTPGHLAEIRKLDLGASIRSLRDAVAIVEIGLNRWRDVYVSICGKDPPSDDGPLEGALLGSHKFETTDGICYLLPDEVRESAAALARLGEVGVCDNVRDDFGVEMHPESDHDHVLLVHFRNLRDLYALAAQAGDSIVVFIG